MDRKNSQGQIFIELCLVLAAVLLITFMGAQSFKDISTDTGKFQMTTRSK